MRRITRHKKLAIGVIVAIVAVFLVFVPIFPLTIHQYPFWGFGNPPSSYTYYGSISYYTSGVGMTYLPNAPFGPVQWTPSFAKPSIVIAIYPPNTFSFNATSATLNFTLSNPTSSNTIISFVKVNQMPCNNANFALVKEGGDTLESCVVSGATFATGEIVNATMSFGNGQSTWGEVTAES